LWPEPMPSRNELLEGGGSRGNHGFSRVEEILEVVAGADALTQ
jgi:hypothetical protein